MKCIVSFGMETDPVSVPGLVWSAQTCVSVWLPSSWTCRHSSSLISSGFRDRAALHSKGTLKPFRKALLKKIFEAVHSRIKRSLTLMSYWSYPIGYVKVNVFISFFFVDAVPLAVTTTMIELIRLSYRPRHTEYTDLGWKGKPFWT